MKPCYIYAKEGMRIDLDGPALCIMAPSQSDILVPLRRVSRVIITGCPECSTPALLACAERGITVTFLQYNGTTRAHLFGRSRAKNDLFVHLRDLLDRPDWADQYQLWLDAAASRARRTLCRKLNLKPDSFTLKQICAALECQMDDFVSAGQRRYLQRRLQGLCSNLVNEVLQQAGMNAEYSRCFEQRLNIPNDFAVLLSLSLQLPLIDWLSQQPKQERINDSDVVVLFEKHSRRLENIARRLTCRLHNFLVNLT